MVVQGRDGPRAGLPEAAPADLSDRPVPAVDERAAAEVIGAFYAAALGEEIWPAALSRLAALLGGQDATLTRVEAPSAGADRPVPAPPRLLSQRERDCLAWVARGATSKHAARQLNLSSHTVDEHVRSAMAKLGVSKRTEAAALALARGLITI